MNVVLVIFDVLSSGRASLATLTIIAACSGQSLSVGWHMGFSTQIAVLMDVIRAWRFFVASVNFILSLTCAVTTLASKGNASHISVTSLAS